MDWAKSGYEQLNKPQQEVVKDCIAKKSGALSLCLGSGKSVCSLVTALMLTKSNNAPILVVMSKSLVCNWENEIEKFFPDLEYKTLHQTVCDVAAFKIRPKYRIYITTADVVKKAYKDNHIDTQFIQQRFVPTHAHLGNYVNFYVPPDLPYLTHSVGLGVLYSQKWGAVIIDEIQLYTSIETQKCQALCALSSHHRWLLSGTLFDEPQTTRILGYHMMLHDMTKPLSLPETKELVKSNKFKGLMEHQVYRKENIAFIPPKINDPIVTHSLTRDEERVYCMMRSVLMNVKKKADQAKLFGNKQEAKLLNSFKLVMVMYLRQAVICSLIPITSILLNVSNLEKRSELSKIVLDEIKQMKMDKYLESKESVASSRFKKVIETTDKYLGKTIIFSCFVTCLDVLYYLLAPGDRRVFKMTAAMTAHQRGELIGKFEKSDAGILLVTYDLGAQGHNLQFATTVMIMDYWWNAAKTQQAIGRIFRFGQTAATINVIFFTANTGIEKIIFEKQKSKLVILEELQHGKQTTRVPKITMDKVIKMIELEDNRAALRSVNYI